MNNLSWTLYFIDVISTVQSFADFFLALSVTIFVVSQITRCAVWGSHDADRKMEIYNQTYKPIFTKFFSYSLRTFIVTSILYTFIPSKLTFILIASSEIGEKMLKSDGAQKIIDPSVELLQEYIKNELKNLKNTQISNSQNSNR